MKESDLDKIPGYLTKKHLKKYDDGVVEYEYEEQGPMDNNTTIYPREDLSNEPAMEIDVEMEPINIEAAAEKLKLKRKYRG